VDLLTTAGGSCSEARTTSRYARRERINQQATQKEGHHDKLEQPEGNLFMGIGAGIVLLALGAVLSWAVEVDLPYVTDDAIGLILVLAGITIVVVSAILNTDHPEAGIGSGVVLVAAGAILSFAVQIDVPYIADYAMGAILMAAGAIATIATLIAITQRRRERDRYQDRHHDSYYDRPAPYPPGRY
jgi:FtsH-binding integral membrane protein